MRSTVPIGAVSHFHGIIKKAILSLTDGMVFPFTNY